MPVAVHITAQNMTKEDYDRVREELHADAGDKGRIYHAAYGDDDLHLFEVWDSRKNFDDHYNVRIANALGGAVSVEIAPLHGHEPT